MTRVVVPESLDDGTAHSQPAEDFVFEPTQLSQPFFSQTQASQANGPLNSQADPRRRYWAIFIPTTAEHRIIKIAWTKQFLQIGRRPNISGDPSPKNDVVLTEKRISNMHCRFTLGLSTASNGATASMIQTWRDGEGDPDVWIEDLESSNGTYVNGQRVKNRRLLQHGDEVSLGHAATTDSHDVRYIYRSVARKPARLASDSEGSLVPRVGDIYERYQLLEPLGKGTFAEVRKAVNIDTGALRAIKQIVKHRFAGNDKTLLMFQREIEICARLEHDNIIRLIDWADEPQHVLLVLEFIDGGDLLDYITNWPGSGLPEAHSAELSLQICRGMAYLHSKGVTHRDLKPENVLITKETDDCPRTIKIADFGLAKMVHAQTMLISMVGTPQYLAPEVVMQTKHHPGYDNVVDSWSVGIIVYSMMTKSLPFDDDVDVPIEQRIRARYTQQYDSGLLRDSGVSDTGIDFISQLLQKQPAERMTMQAALDHEWLAGPSSQPVASQQQGLGGDSMWSIDSYEDDASAGSEADEQEARTRQVTVSGTNFDSHLGEGSGESFSQPMQQLSLRTPARPSKLSVVQPPLVQEWCLQQREITVADEKNSTTRETLTADPLLPPPMGDGIPSTVEANETHRLGVQLDTPPTPDTAGPPRAYSKRKRHPGRGGADAMFDSNSLSSLEETEPRLDPGNAQPIPKAEALVSGAQAAAQAVKHDAIDVADEDDRHRPNNGVVRQSTRSTRNRKSMRIV